ncbi:hypothetical protein CYPRO_1333 [Cyclonatronum proteinivorum]|uniref:Uncharacterized protein n=1 Tax=Cyclonatronum proteinivorum TaxID=1457365 RepID=A0A345UJD8_9BACT|nr:hypothetical protein CYPRO_1333 [Cyclonatronum proteinivorum]
MDLIAVLLAIAAVFLLWETDLTLLRWLIIISAILAWYFRRVVSSLQRRDGLIDPDVAKFWANLCVITVWTSIFLSLIGIMKSL